MSCLTNAFHNCLLCFSVIGFLKMVLGKLHPGSVIWRLCLPRRFQTFFGTDWHYSATEAELRADLLDERASSRNYVRSVIRSGADEAYASIQANVHRHRSARAGTGA